MFSLVLPYLFTLAFAAPLVWMFYKSFKKDPLEAVIGLVSISLIILLILTW